MTFALVPHRRLTPPRYAGLGEVRRVARDLDRRLVAIASDLELTWSGGRDAPYPACPIRHRVALHDERDDRRIAVFDEAAYSINDLAFHPSEPLLAIAMGTYDGFVDFPGGLLLWNWETGAWRSVFGGSDEIIQIEYRDAGRRLAVLARARPLEEPPDLPFGGPPPLPANQMPDELASSDECVVSCGVIDDLASREGATDPRIDRFRVIDPARIGVVRRRLFSEVAGELARLGAARRPAVLDLAWHTDGRLVAASASGTVELWHADGTLSSTLQAPGAAPQLLRHPDDLLVHVIVKGGPQSHSALYAVRDDRLVEWRTFPTQCTFSIDTRGRILVRDTNGSPSRADQVLARDGAVMLSTNLGAYSTFEHAVRIDGEDALYYLRGLRGKALCSIDDALELHEEMAWDHADALALSIGSAVLVEDDLVRAFTIYNPPEPDRSYLERYSLERGVRLWRRPVTSITVALAAWPAARAVIAGLGDGMLCALDLDTGERIHHEPLELDGAITTVTALAVLDEAIAIGTVDGQLAIYALR